MADLEPLFRPFPFGATTLRNRVVMAPMTRNFSPGGVPGPDVAAYYRRRAAGGVGLIVTEGTTVPHPAADGYARVPAFHGDAALAGWRAVAEAVHAEGGAIIPQLWHVGSVRRSGRGPDPSAPPHGPSAVPHPYFGDRGEVPHPMTQADIDHVVSAFARAARDAQRLGFDGVEIHGAHGYLIDQFFWSVTNRREDAYGGSLEARGRFGCEVVAAIREAVGPSFPIVFRMSQWKLGDYRFQVARDPSELERWVAPLAQAGVDVFHCSMRRIERPEFPGSDRNLAGWVRHLTGRPTIGVGSVGLATEFLHTNAGEPTAEAGLEPAIAALERAQCDLVAVGRALLADPDWVRKVREGRLDEVRVYCRDAEKTLY